MNNDLISRGDAIAVAMHSKDPVEGIKHLPAVDAVEVKHGRWLSLKTPKGSAVILCSECRKTADWWRNYCHNCGARMDGE